MYAMCDLSPGDQEEEDVTLPPTSKHRSRKFQPLVQEVLHDNVREHENIRMGGTIAVLDVHVHKSTQDSPFFLTFMHDSRMPFFDMDKPRVAYGADFVSETFRMMQHVHQAVKVNLEDAQECSKRYYDKTAKERSFLPGDKDMVYFPNAPPRINPNFFSHWVPYTVVQMVGKVNAQVRNNKTGKSSIIHLDRIKELKENLEDNEETAGSSKQQDTVASHAKENEGKQHEEVQVGRGPADAAVLAQDRDIREQVEAEQGKKPRTKPKKQKQPEIAMPSGWLPRVDHTGKKGPQTRSMGLQIDYLDNHRTKPAEERRRQIWAEESRREEEEFRDYPDYKHMSRPAGLTMAEQEADWSFESATSGPAWQGWQPDCGQEGPEADFFTAEAGQQADILGAHADFIGRLEPINEEQEEKQLVNLGIQADPREVRQVPQLQSSERRRGRSGGRPTDPGTLDHFRLPAVAPEYKQRKKKVQN
jgi:hypothetical protein